MLIVKIIIVLIILAKEAPYLYLIIVECGLTKPQSRTNIELTSTYKNYTTLSKEKVTQLLYHISISRGSKYKILVVTAYVNSTHSIYKT